LLGGCAVEACGLGDAGCLLRVAFGFQIGEALGLGVGLGFALSFDAGTFGLLGELFLTGFFLLTRDLVGVELVGEETAEGEKQDDDSDDDAAFHGAM